MEVWRGNRIFKMEKQWERKSEGLGGGGRGFVREVAGAF